MKKNKFCLSVSNLAWKQEEEQSIINMFKKHNINGIDVALTKIWPKPLNVNDNILKSYKRYWSNNGINIISLQSLLYGCPQMTIFDDSDRRSNTLLYLSKIIVIARKLGCSRVIFGSPTNRLVGRMDKEKVDSIALDFFRKISEISYKNNQIFCIEPNPVQCGCDYINNHDDAAELVKRVNHDNFKINIDTSTLISNGEDPVKIINKLIDYAGYFHFSEPGLKSFGDIKYKVIMENIIKILNNKVYSDWVSLEILASKTNNISKIETSIELINKPYRE